MLALARSQSVALVESPKKKSPDRAKLLYNGRHGYYKDLPEAKPIMPQVSQREEQKQNYGRQIPESQPEEVHAAKIKG